MTSLDVAMCKVWAECLTVNVDRLRTALEEGDLSEVMRLASYVEDDAAHVYNTLSAAGAIPAPAEDTDVPTLEEWATSVERHDVIAS